MSDPSGAAVVDAKVSIQNLETGFSFTALPVGRNQIVVEKQGFTKYVQSGIILVLEQTANVPVQLNVGNLSQEVTVSANAELLNTQSGTVGQLIDQRRIVDLPLDGRQPQNLLFLSAGTVNQTGNYCLVNCQGGAGAVVKIVTKSGTNEIHGDVFEFVRNSDLNARNFFAPTQDTLKRNQYGGSVGGPIIKNKLFYFGTYQGTPIRSAAQGNVAFVPTAAERTGDFAGSGIVVTHPTTGQPDHYLASRPRTGLRGLSGKTARTKRKR